MVPGWILEINRIILHLWVMVKLGDKGSAYHSEQHSARG